MRASVLVAIVWLAVTGVAGCSTDTTQLEPGTPAERVAHASPSRQEVLLPLPVGESTTRGARPATPKGSSKRGEAFDVVTVFWGTNRHLPTNFGKRHIADTITENGRKLSLGFAHVTVPKVGREPGSLQRPARYAVLDVTLYAEREDPRRHFTIGDIKVLDQATFVSAVDATQQLSKRFRGEAFIFVHGYSTPLHDALFRTAQLAYDLEFDGAPYVFSWPSRGSVSGYLHDKDAADSSRRYLQEFLQFVASRTRARRVHLIAHSMGARLLSEVLRSMPPTPAGAPTFEQIVLAAPDIDADVFREIAASVQRAGRSVTLYASRNDKALATSRTLAIGRVRVGEVTASGPTLIEGIDTIDISDADRDTFWGVNHSTFAERSPVLRDMQALIEKGTRPPEMRTSSLSRIHASGSNVYWKYVPSTASLRH